MQLQKKKSNFYIFFVFLLFFLPNFLYIYMSKKKSTNKQAVLSPENYIRQKSRNLPIGECYINQDWEKNQMCRIIITRKHVTGNVTACVYLVDLACLGVKNTMFRFNISRDDLTSFLDKAGGDTLIDISYELAHNIIYAALEYAENYGFQPHKEYTSITRHFLEEDNDDIPLIDVECGGKDGKPLYTNTGFDSPAREREILAQLERTAGDGNYHYILPGHEDMYYDDDDDDDDDDDA